MNTFAVLGGDLRFVYLAGALAEDGFSVITAGFDHTDLPHCVTGCTRVDQAVKGADFVILPLPVTTDGTTLNAPFSRSTLPLADVVSCLHAGQTVLGGQLQPALLQEFRDNGVRAFDYFSREELIVQNAVPTAEGALQLALEELPVTLAGASCLVTGFGRVSKALCRLLYALGANVTVAARRVSDRALANTLGYAAVPLAALADAGAFDVVFNTVPALIFDEPRLRALAPSTLIIDLASRPGGVDFAAAAGLGLKTIWALSLPGRVAPKSAGIILKDTILNILKEEGEAV